MANRTLQITGYGYGSTPATVVVTFDGSEIFSGEVPTLDQENVLILPSEQTVLCTTEIPMNFSGTKPLVFQVTNGNVCFAEQLTNYQSRENPVFTTAELEILDDSASTQAERIAVYSAHATPSFTAEDIVVLEGSDTAAKQVLLAEHGVSHYITAGADVYGTCNTAGLQNTDVSIDGTPVVYPDPNPYAGSFYWTVNNGSTLSCTVNISPGKEFPVS